MSAYKTMGDEAVLLEMLKLMLSDALANDVTEIKEAHANGNWDKVQQIAHKIKGGAVYVGATRMKMACFYLERYVKTGHRDLLERLYQQLVLVISDSIGAIEAALNGT